MSETSLPKMSGAQKFFVMFVIVVFAGVLGANPLADAIGIDPLSDQYYGETLAKRIVCGRLVAVATPAFLIAAAFLIRLVAALLSRVDRKPPMPMAVALLVAGTLCLLATLWFEWEMAHYSKQTAAAVAVQMGPVSTGSLRISMQSPLAGQIMALGTFLAGSALLSIGIWSGIPHAGPEFAGTAAPHGE